MFKDAWLHAAVQKHEVIVIFDVFGVSVPLSLRLLMSLCGFSEEQVTYAYLEDKLKDFLGKPVKQHSQAKDQQ